MCYSMCTVSDPLKARLSSSSASSQLRHLHSSSHHATGSLHHQDPLEAALLAAARGQHGAGIPGNVIPSLMQIVWCCVVQASFQHALL
jgi:hypothetical protein